jgi:hypothetical protein
MGFTFKHISTLCLAICFSQKVHSASKPVYSSSKYDKIVHPFIGESRFTLIQPVSSQNDP